MAVSIYEQVKRALQDIIAPEIKGLQVEIKRLDEKIESMRKELLAEIKRIDERFTTEIKRLDEKIEGLTKEIEIAIEIRERLATIEGRLGIEVKSGK